MDKRKGEKEAHRAVSDFTPSHCRKPPLGSLNTLKRDFVFKNVIILFSIANIKYIKGGFFSKNHEGIQILHHFWKEQQLLQAQVPEDRGEVEMLCTSCCWSCWTSCRCSREMGDVLGDAPDRQPGAFLALGAEGGCSCLGEAESSWQCCEFPPGISQHVLLMTCFVFQRHQEQPRREFELRSIWAVNLPFNFCCIPNQLFTVEELLGLPGSLVHPEPESLFPSTANPQHCRNIFMA